MNAIPALLVISCVVSSTVFAADIKSATEDYIWQERFAERMELARTGSAEAQFNVGEMYEKGSGVPANMKSAFTWFELAAKQDHQKAQYKVAYMYFRGEGVDANPTKAFQMMDRLAKIGYARAQYYLASMYETGIGTSRNLDHAQLWYSRASASGYTPATEVLADKKRFPAPSVQIESARAEPVQAQPKNTTGVKSATTPNSLPSQNMSSLGVNLPTAKNDPIASVLRDEVARGNQIALGLGLGSHASHLTTPITTIAGLQPIIQQPTVYSALVNGNWVSQMNLPVEFLPSKLTSCEPSDEKALKCVSKELVRMIGEAEIGYKAEATVYAVQPTGEFKISYRNNIVKIHRRPNNKTATDAASTPEIKLGLQETEHHLDCKLENDWTIQCLKNHTQKIKLSNQVAM